MLKVWLSYPAFVTSFHDHDKVSENIDFERQEIVKSFWLGHWNPIFDSVKS